MAIMDELGQFNTEGTPYDLDQENATYVLPNSIDLGLTGRDPGMGQPVYLNIVVTEAFTDGGDSATLSFSLNSDSVEDVAESGSTIHLITPPLLKAALVAGARYSYTVPPAGGGNTYERYLGLMAIIATAGFDSGMVEAWLGHDPIGIHIGGFADATN